MRRIAAIVILLSAATAALAAIAGADDARTYKIEMYSAFGIVDGSDVRVAGVNAGTVTDLDVNADKRAVVTIELTGDVAELGTETTCSSEPQSLIAEYFIDCEPKGPPLDDGATIPASRVSQTVQPDLVQSTLREPYADRFQLLLNEFGTALAGNPESLNEAIRLGAPALTETHRATRILADQSRILRDLTANSDRVIGELARVRQDVVSFVDEAEDAATISADRRDDLSRNFELLDDALAELEPALASLDDAAQAQTPVLTDLRAVAGGLNEFALRTPGFARETERALTSLGEAGVAGREALRNGGDEVRLLADSGRNAPATAEILADFVRDIGDPRRATEIDDRAAVETGRDNPVPGRRDTRGFTGFESLLNFAYYVAASTLQFDKVAHSMHIDYHANNTGPCGQFVTGYDEETGEPGIPTDDGGTTTDILEAASCVQWLGPNQPGISEDFPLPPYDPAVCPNGTAPAAAEALCSPEGAQRAGVRRARRQGERRAGAPKLRRRSAGRRAGDQQRSPGAAQGLGGLADSLQGTLEDLGIDGQLDDATGRETAGPVPLGDLLEFLMGG